ncbi:MAG: hypothetical protein AAFV46_02960 [Cyanobacteria bacterium J06635_11]
MTVYSGCTGFFCGFAGKSISAYVSLMPMRLVAAQLIGRSNEFIIDQDAGLEQTVRILKKISALAVS